MPHLLDDEYGLSVSVDPTGEPVGLAEMKNWLKVDHAEDDTMIRGLIETARIEAETLTKQSFVNRTVLQTHADFPFDNKLVLRAAPVSSVTSVIYSDADGSPQTFSSDDYRVVTDRVRPYIKLKTAIVWPTTEADNDTAVQVTMIAGFGATAGALPDNLRTAIQMIVAYAYENRGDGRPVVRLAQVREVLMWILGPSMIVEF